LKTLVIADLHLKFEDKRIENISKFFHKIGNEFNRIIILGDFFEFWYGFKRVIISDYFETLYELKKLLDKGIKIFYIEGNHDIFMGDFFKKLGVEVYSEFLELKIADKKYLFMHGDTVNLKNDKFYLYLRRFLRSRFASFLMNNIPPYLTLQIAEKFSKVSRDHFYKNNKLDKIIDNFISEKKGYDIFVSGHFHTNYIHKNFYIVGDWGKEINYLEIDESGKASHQTL